MDPVSVQVELEESDVRKGMLFTLWRHTPGIRFAPIFFLFALAGFVLSLYGLASGEVERSPQFVFLAICTLFLIGLPYAFFRLSKRAFEAVSYPGGEVRFSRENIRITINGELETYAWKALFEVREARGAILIHPKRGAFRIVPKRALGEHEESVRGAIARYGPPVRSRWIGWASPSGWMLFALVIYLTYVALTS